MNMKSEEISKLVLSQDEILSHTNKVYEAMKPLAMIMMLHRNTSTIYQKRYNP